MGLRRMWFCAIIAVVAVIRTEPVPAADTDSIMVFLRTPESHEHAFSYLRPSGWISLGGVVRRDPLAPSVNPLIVAPQLDFTVARDSTGSALIRWMPNLVYCDLQRTHVRGSELFPPGSTYQGMLVYPKVSAREFLTKFMFREAHPKAENVRIISEQSLRSLAREYAKLVRDAPGKFTFGYDAATLSLTYDEGGVTYEERWLAVVEDWGEMGGGQWGNKETVFFRAPISEFDALSPVFEVVHGSIAGSPGWAAAEMPLDSAQRDVGLKTRRNVRDFNRRMTLHHQRISNLIHSALFGGSGEAVVYVNPFTGDEERSPATWTCRWDSPRSDVLLGEDSTYSPELDVRLAGHQFRRCETLSDTASPSHTVSASVARK